MDNEKLISKIFFEIQKDPSDYRAYEDVFSLCRSIEESDFKLAHDTNTELRSYISRGMKTSAYAKLFDLYRRSLLFDAPYKFDSYLLYIEINRKPEERFYQPRRRILKQVVDNLQELTTLRAKVEAMEKEKLIAGHKAQFLAIGYDEALADATANE